MWKNYYSKENVYLEILFSISLSVFRLGYLQILRAWPDEVLMEILAYVSNRSTALILSVNEGSASTTGRGGAGRALSQVVHLVLYF